MYSEEESSKCTHGISWPTELSHILKAGGFQERIQYKPEDREKKMTNRFAPDFTQYPSSPTHHQTIISLTSKVLSRVTPVIFPYLALTFSERLFM